MMQLIDTDRYPLDRLDDATGKSFVRDCAASFGAHGVLVLPGFLTSDAVTEIAADAQSRIDDAFFCQSEHTVFLRHALVEDHFDGLDPNDPRLRLLRTRVGSIANDLLPDSAVLQRLYDWPPLTRFIGAVLDHHEFYRSADPLGALSVNVYGHGDKHEWHFDESRFSVTIMIQEAEMGGHFEYVPGLRTDDRPDLDAIRDILDGDESRVQRLAFKAGSLSIFGGRDTLHRVGQIRGNRARLVPVLTYDTTPGSVNSDAVRELFWGRTG